MSRQTYLLGWGLALVALALAVTDWALNLQPGVTEANVRRIRPGMTMKQVKAILGDSALEGGHPINPLDPCPCPGPIASWCITGDASWYYHWIGSQGYAFVTFSASDIPHNDEMAFPPHARVEAAGFVRTGPPPLLQHLRDWLGW